MAQQQIGNPTHEITVESSLIPGQLYRSILGNRPIIGTFLRYEYIETEIDVHYVPVFLNGDGDEIPLYQYPIEDPSTALFVLSSILYPVKQSPQGYIEDTSANQTVRIQVVRPLRSRAREFLLNAGIPGQSNPAGSSSTKFDSDISKNLNTMFSNRQNTTKSRKLRKHSRKSRKHSRKSRKSRKHN